MNGIIASERRAKILVVDDERTNISLLHDLLKADYDIMAATSGEQALKIVVSGQPDLILVDVMMPGMDGYEVCERLKHNPLTADIPVIFLTGMSDQKSEAAGLERGALDYITKPINPPVVKFRVRNQIELKLSRDALKQKNAELSDNNARLNALLATLEQTQNQLMQSEKMAAIGQLAAGVAHEINNPIGFVTSNLGTLGRYVKDLMKVVEAAANCSLTHNCLAIKEVDLPFLRQDIPALLAESRDGLERVRKIVANLKDFSHVDEAEWQQADLIAGLESTINVVWHELKYKTEIVRELQPLPPVRCIPAQINQVLMNLLINAAQAIPERGVITLKSGLEDDQVWLEVADTGSGMSEEVRRRLFEPFFTTKPVGQGTGLGLSLSYDIINKHGGRFDIESTLGVGSRIRFWLPIAGG